MSELTEETATPAEQPKSLSLLASERFPGHFYGDVKEPEETSVEAPDTHEETPAEIEAESPEDTPEIEETEEVIEEEPAVIESVDEFVDYFKETTGNDIDPEWFESLQVRGKVNGEDVTYSLGELKGAVQKVTAADDILQTAKEKVSEQWQELNQQKEQITQQFAVASTLVNQMESALVADIESVDWDSLKAEDPATYSAKKIEVQERRQALESIKQNAGQQYMAFVQNQQAEIESQRQEQLVAESHALLEKLPDWHDTEKSKVEKAAINEYLGSQGFSPEELGNVADHRLVVLARKAWLYDQQPEPHAAMKRIQKIPKTLTPGPKKSPSEVNQASLNEKRNRLSQTGKIDDAFELMRARRTQ